MSFISYAQNFEDVMLWRALKNIENGFYIDVGANDPLDDSVTKAFYNHGWSGINVEPEKKYFDLLRVDRERDINLDVAASNQADDIKLFIFDIRGWSTNDQLVAEQHKAEGHDYQTRIIKTKSLDQICEENHVDEVHFLKIDVEGAEKDVLESFSFKKVRPWIVVIEATKPNTTIDISQKWEYILLEHQYSFAYFDGINKFYVAKEYPHLMDSFGYPPNAFDDFISIDQYRAERRAERAEEKTDEAMAGAADALVHLEIARNQYQEIIGSRSWRITEPLRSLLYTISQLKSGSNQKNRQKKSQLLVDVSQIYFDDNQTGIQRVIHNILFELSALSLDEYNLLPVYATMDQPYHYTAKFHPKNLSLSQLDEKPVEVQQGDIFLGLDLTAHLFPQIEMTLEKYRQNGVSINYIVYDIIPLLYPQFTTEGMDEYFKRWLNGLVECADRLICISHSVALDLQNYIDEYFPSIERMPEITSFHLGAGIDTKVKSYRLAIEEKSMLHRIGKRLTFLMVGTVEPRKGYYQVLLAFEELWAKGTDINLVIVGKKGWMVETLLGRLDNHPEHNRHLFWLQGINDEYLRKLYISSSCLIAASKTEGFGLPMIEAARFSLPVIARDIPVFRELAEEYAFYFSDDDKPETVTNAICEWIELNKSGEQPCSEDIPWLSWRESAKELLACLEIDAKTKKQEGDRH